MKRLGDWILWGSFTLVLVAVAILIGIEAMAGMSMR